MSKTTSLELSKQLKEAGAKQRSEKIWHRDKYDAGYLLSTNIWGDEDTRNDCFESWYNTFDCHELLGRLPLGTELSTDRLGCMASFKGAEFGGDRANTPAEALGKLYLWCLENGHCEKDGGS